MVVVAVVWVGMVVRATVEVGKIGNITPSSRLAIFMINTLLPF